MREPQRPIQDGTGELGVEWRPAWRLRDPVIETDAKALWERLSLLPTGVDLDQRAEELVCAAYVDGEIAGAATAFVRDIDFLKARFAMFRCAVDPKFRAHSIARKIAGVSKDILQTWAFETTEDEVLGMATVVQSADIQAKSRSAIWRTSGLVLVGYTDMGEQIRVAWFDHARI
jgi:hypothetical protein